MSESPQVQAMQALELLAERAYRDDDPLTFAIVDEAGELLGFPSPNLVSMVGGNFEEIIRYLNNARYRRNRKLLRAKATGLLLAVEQLIGAGALEGAACSQARWRTWRAEQSESPARCPMCGLRMCTRDLPADVPCCNPLRSPDCWQTIAKLPKHGSVESRAIAAAKRNQG